VRPGPVVYLLRCSDGSLYCGWTLRLESRLSAHRSGRGSKYVASRLPFALAAVLPMADRTAAMREEARIKRLTRAEKEALLAKPEEWGLMRGYSA
jgi:predicted GIY-YIG superfamily endonuclease